MAELMVDTSAPRMGGSPACWLNLSPGVTSAVCRGPAAVRAAAAFLEPLGMHARQPAHQPQPAPCPRSAVEQLVEVSQTRAIADALLRLRRQLGEGGGGAARGRSLAQLLDQLEAGMDEQVRHGSRNSQKTQQAQGGQEGGAFCQPEWPCMPQVCCHGQSVVLQCHQLANQWPRCLYPALPSLQGVDSLAGRSKPGNLARPRRFELAAAINRLRTAQLRQLKEGGAA